MPRIFIKKRFTFEGLTYQEGEDHEVDERAYNKFVEDFGEEGYFENFSDEERAPKEMADPGIDLEGEPDLVQQALAKSGAESLDGLLKKTNQKLIEMGFSADEVKALRKLLREQKKKE